MQKVVTCYIFYLIGMIFLCSCTLFKPLPLESFGNANSIQGIEKFGLSGFNGDYEIISADSNFCTLDYAFIYADLLHSKKQPTKNVYVNLEAIDDQHIKTKFFVNNRIVQEKIVHGQLIDNYFNFHSSQLKFRFLINVYEQQTNRLALSKDGDLYLDTNRGGIAFFIIMPIPLSGSSFDTYNLKFKRKK
jgi:hypothetical protein